jgi:hypothetical protein
LTTLRRCLARLNVSRGARHDDEQQRKDDREMIARETSGSVSSMFTADEWDALRLLHERYHHERDLFSNHEMGRLRFVRWLYRTGRLTTGEDDDGLPLACPSCTQPDTLISLGVRPERPNRWRPWIMTITHLYLCG